MVRACSSTDKRFQRGTFQTPTLLLLTALGPPAPAASGTAVPAENPTACIAAAPTFLYAFRIAARRPTRPGLSGAPRRRIHASACELRQLSDNLSYCITHTLANYRRPMRRDISGRPCMDNSAISRKWPIFLRGDRVTYTHIIGATSAQVLNAALLGNCREVLRRSERCASSAI